MKKKVLLILSCLLLSIGFVVAQTTRATGTVVDSNGEPVVSASVVVKGTTVGTVTDMDGKFSVNISDGNSVLVFSLIGMKQVEAKADQNMRIVMEENVHALSEVVLEVPYGVAKKESFTGSAEVISNTKITKRPVANVTKAIEGQVTGVRATSGTGQPGEGASIRIRGVGSINASSDPLYVVDGAPYAGSISAINPNDIASITVLKDAAAGALYGSRGANGVIMISTKKGQSGKLQINLKANWGVASRAIPRYETLDERGYIQSAFHSLRAGDVSAAAGKAAINTLFNGSSNRIFGENAEYFPFVVPAGVDPMSMIDPLTGLVDPSAQLRYDDDWLDSVTAENPLRQEYNLVASGGTEKTKYMFSLGYLNEEGLLETTKFERFSGRVGVDSELHKWVKSGLNVNFAKNTSNTSNTASSASSNVFSSAQGIAPIYPIYIRNADGSYKLNAAGERQFDYGDTRASGASGGFNSVATLYEDKYGTESDNFSGRTYLEIGNFKDTPFDGLKFTTNLSVDYQNAAVMTYYNPYFGNSEAVKGTLDKSARRTFSYTFNQLLYYDKNINEDHHIGAMVGHEFYSRDYSYLGATKTGFPFGGLHELDAATNISSASSYKDIHTIESVLSNLTYDYKSRYYLSASVRTDGSSRFHQEGRWGTFWSVGGSWRASEESFLNDKEWLDNLTVKATYGVQGNDNVLDSDGYQLYYAWQGFYDLAWSNATQSGALASSLENKDLKWEKSGNLNIGVEARLFNRLNASIEYFSRNTSDLLLYYPMAASTGFDGYYKNAAKMKNYGLDIMLGGEVMKTKDFDWNVTLMGTFLKNEVTSLYGSKPIDNGLSIIREGDPINSFFVPRSAGVDPATGDQLYWVFDKDENGNRKGDYYISNNAQKATASKEVQGSRFPDFEGSVATDFRYKDFDLSILTTYSIGGKIMDGAYRQFLYPTYIGQAAHSSRLRAWTKPGDMTDIPRLVIGKNYIYTTDDLIDASYFAIKNITLGYNLPSNILKSTGLGGVRFTATADNLILFNHMKGMNNQSSLSGTNSFSTYTPTRTIAFGVDIKF